MIATRIYVLAAIAAIVIAATAITSTLPATAQQSTIHIIKHGSNSYAISGGSSTVGSFDTTYTIAGERSAIRSAENLIITTITNDFRTSPTIGYIRAGGTGTTTGTDAALPNPFASHEQITERITTELRRMISEAESNTSQGQHVEIRCNFGMTLEDMRCHHGTLPQAGQ
jgi:Ca2+-binding RTX toxin-like protein